MNNSAYDAILTAARNRFSADGYQAVTIREIAAEAGYSAAMVMKLMGSKERLFWLVAPGVASTDRGGSEHDLIPRSELGGEFVRRIFRRRSAGTDDPYAIAPIVVRAAPEPALIRIEIWDRYVHNLAAIIGDDTADRRHAKSVSALLMGVATAVHTMDAYQGAEDAAAIETYSALVQTVIDRCTGPRSPLPDESVGTTAARRRAQREENRNG